MKVRIFRNIGAQYKGKACVWSMQAKVDGAWKTVDHVDGVALKDAKFVISAAGQARARKEGQRNVHAFVEGELVQKYPQNSLPKLPGHDKCRAKPVLPSGSVRVDYNPFHLDTFVRADCEKPIHDAKNIVIGPGGVYAQSLPPCRPGMNGLGGVRPRKRCNGSDWNG